MSGTADLQNSILAHLSNTSPMRLAQLEHTLGRAGNVITQAMCKIIRRGFVDRLEAGLYAITNAGLQFIKEGGQITSGPREKHSGNRRPNRRMSLGQRVWNVMRMGDAFDVPSLVAAAQNTTDKAPQNNIQRYVRHLVKAGYLHPLPTRTKGTRPGSNGFSRYRLARDTGDTAPTLRLRSNPVEVFDQNTKEVFPCV